MKLIAIRHTPVDVPSGICYGQTDVPLTPAFPQEREWIKSQLKEMKFDMVYCSPLSRCSRLAEFICQDKPIVEDTRLMELNFGKWEGRLWEQIGQTNEAETWFTDWVHQKCPLGESYMDLINRATGFLSEIKAKYPNETILIVTHGGIIRALNGIIHQTPPQQAFDLVVDYGSIWQWNINRKN